MASRVIASMTAAGIVAGAAITAGLAVADVPSHDVEALPVIPAGGLGGGTIAGAETTFSADSKIAPSAAGDMAMTVDGRYWVPPIINYLVETDLAGLGGTGTAWRFPTGVTPDKARIEALAEVLGLTGEVRTTEYGWEVIDGDRSLSVSNDAMGSWWYSAPSPNMWVCAAVEPAVADPAVSGPADEGSVEGEAVPDPAIDPCPEPTPPTGLPAADEAQRQAQALFDAAGFGDLALTTNAYEWGVDVNGMPSYGNVPGDIGFYVGFGQDAAITYAGGYLNRPVEVGDYPLIDGQAAIDRLKDGGGFGVAAYARDSLAATDVGVAMPAPDAPVECVTDPCEPAPPAEPEVIDIRLTGVTKVLMQWWSADGTVWLLPAYRFTDPDGAWYPVLAVTDEYLPAQPEPVPLPEPAPLDCTDPAVTCEPVGESSPGSEGSGPVDTAVAVETPDTTPAATTVSG